MRISATVSPPAGGAAATDIAEAGNGEVKEIFEAAIMPVGSFWVKQSTSFSATLNAYPGIFYGAETLQGSNGTKGFGGVAGPMRGPLLEQGQ